MRLTRKNAARLASISALGAGTLSIAAGTAEAGSITYTALDGEVGIFAGAIGTASTFKARVVPGATFIFGKEAPTSSGQLLYGVVRLFAFSTSGFRKNGGTFAFRRTNAAAGQKWSSAPLGAVRNSTLGVRTSQGGHLGQTGTFYKLFAFATHSRSVASKLDFGWLKLQQVLSSNAGPDLKIEGLAFENTPNVLIAAGDQGTGSGSSTPESSTAALASLAALSLGAVGLRRWRAARKQTA